MLILIVGSVQQSYAEESFLFLKDGQHLKKDAWDKDRINIIDKTGNKTEYIKKDFFNKERKNIVNQSGNRAGYVEKDFFQPDKWNVVIDE